MEPARPRLVLDQRMDRGLDLAPAHRRPSGDRRSPGDAPVADAIVTIPYGGVPVDRPRRTPLAALGLEPDRYLVSIARIEPDNNILPIVEAFSRRAPRREAGRAGHAASTTIPTIAPSRRAAGAR